jgi:hypothetical protein
MLLSLLICLPTLLNHVFALEHICPTFIAQGSSATTYHVNFYDSGLDPNVQTPITLPANMTGGNPTQLAAGGHSHSSLHHGHLESVIHALHGPE